jgi:hypothetical protein
MRRSIKELLDEKVSVVEKKMGKKPFEALGISEEQYMNMKESSRYTRLCECLSYNCIPIPRNRKTHDRIRPYVENYKIFLRYASKDDKDSIISLIDEALSKNKERIRIQEEINLKKRELKELENKLKSNS